MWNSKETFPKCIFQFTSMPQFTFSPTTFIPKAYFYKNKPKGLKVTKEDPRLIGSMRGFCDKYIHIFFSISTSFSLYPHLFEYIHIPHYYIHIFSSISTSVVACLELLLQLKIMSGHKIHIRLTAKCASNNYSISNVNVYLDRGPKEQ